MRQHPGPFLAEITGPGGAVPRDLQRRGERVARQAERLAPVRTGRLRGSIRVHPATRVGLRVSVLIEATAPYALYVHNGTRHMRARRFLVNALPAAAG